MSIVAVIPARYDSKRFPGKPLADLCGKPLIYWTWRQAAKCELIDTVLVATDDERIVKAVESFGGRAVMTSQNVASGSDRIAEAVRDLDCELVVNVQGDEPAIPPQTVCQAIQALMEHPECDVSTACVAIRRIEEFKSTHAVKVALDLEGRALYFSRSPLPNRTRSTPAISETDAVWGYKHLGLYVFRKETLLEFTQWEPTLLEKMEKLEQLRFLEHGRKIIVIETEHDSVGVDTVEDLEVVRELMKLELEQKKTEE